MRSSHSEQQSLRNQHLTERGPRRCWRSEPSLLTPKSKGPRKGHDRQERRQYRGRPGLDRRQRREHRAAAVEVLENLVEQDPSGHQTAGHANARIQVILVGGQNHCRHRDHAHDQEGANWPAPKAKSCTLPTSSTASRSDLVDSQPTVLTQPRSVTHYHLPGMAGRLAAVTTRAAGR